MASKRKEPDSKEPGDDGGKQTPHKIARRDDGDRACVYCGAPVEFGTLCRQCNRILSMSYHSSQLLGELEQRRQRYLNLTDEELGLLPVQCNVGAAWQCGSFPPGVNDDRKSYFAYRRSNKRDLSCYRCWDTIYSKPRTRFAQRKSAAKATKFAPVWSHSSMVRYDDKVRQLFDVPQTWIGFNREIRETPAFSTKPYDLDGDVCFFSEWEQGQWPFERQYSSNFVGAAAAFCAAFMKNGARLTLNEVTAGFAQNVFAFANSLMIDTQFTKIEDANPSDVIRHLRFIRATLRPKPFPYCLDFFKIYCHPAKTQPPPLAPAVKFVRGALFDKNLLFEIESFLGPF